jgi:antitoxin VapB
VPALNIKNDEAYRLIRELADREGKSMTTVVIEAVREKLEREPDEDSDDLADKLLAIGRSTAPMWSEYSLATRHGDLLYDEYGLPM